MSQSKNRVWVSEWVLTSSQEAPNPSRSGYCGFSTGEEFSSVKSQTNRVGEAIAVFKEAKQKHEELNMFLK